MLAKNNKRKGKGEGGGVNTEKVGLLDERLLIIFF